MVDFHSHILPEMDDGAKDVDMTVKMLEMSFSQGVGKIVATPHFYAESDKPEDFFARRAAAARKLTEVFDEERMPTVYLGAEVAYYSGISNSEMLKEMCIVGTKYILVEMPTERWGDKVLDDLVKIKKYGYSPIIAHVERCLFSQRKGLAEELIRNGIMLQTNAEAFSHFGVRKKILRMIEEDEIHVIGSDAHNVSDRAPDMAKAYEAVSKRFERFTLNRFDSISNMILRDAVPVTEIEFVNE